MSNVLIGIVGVILFIGLVVAAATFFGPVAKDSIGDANAGGVIRVLTATSNAVVIRNREMETVTQGSVDSNVLVPNFLEDTPVNPVSQAPVMMVDATFRPVADARFVVSRMRPSDEAACAYLNMMGGGTRSVPTMSSAPSRKIGCARVGVANGVFAVGEMVAFSAVE